MLGNKNPNIQMIESMVAKLGALSDDMVFLGGCATGLLTTETGVVLPRVTVDVDAIVEVASLGDYHKLSEKLRTLKFSEDLSPDAPICRWR